MSGGSACSWLQGHTTRRLPSFSSAISPRSPMRRNSSVALKARLSQRGGGNCPARGVLTRPPWRVSPALPFAACRVRPMKSLCLMGNLQNPGEPVRVVGEQVPLLVQCAWEPAEPAGVEGGAIHLHPLVVEEIAQVF